MSGWRASEVNLWLYTNAHTHACAHTCEYHTHTNVYIQHTHNENINVTIYPIYLLLTPGTPPPLNFGKGALEALVKNGLKAFQKYQIKVTLFGQFSRPRRG